MLQASFSHASFRSAKNENRLAENEKFIRLRLKKRLAEKLLIVFCPERKLKDI